MSGFSFSNIQIEIYYFIPAGFIECEFSQALLLTPFISIKKKLIAYFQNRNNLESLVEYSMAFIYIF